MIRLHPAINISVCLLLACVAPPAAASENAGSAVSEVVSGFMTAIGERDTAALAALLLEEGELISLRPDGSIGRMSHADYLQALDSGSGSLREDIFDVVVHVRGDFASAWTPYRFYLNGNLRHCGVNNFSLVRLQGTWRVASVTYSMETEGCDASLE